MTIKKNHILTTFALLLFGVFTTAGLSQDLKEDGKNDDKWIRAQSDNGEFSVEVPDQYDCYFDKGGYTISNHGISHVMGDMTIFNSYREGILLSFESFRTKNPGGAFEMMRGLEGRLGTIKSVKLGDKTIDQMIVKTDKYYLIRRFILSKDHLYILSAGARNEGSKTIDRFLKSVSFKGLEPVEIKNGTEIPIVSFSSLRSTPIELKTENVIDGRGKSPVKKNPEPEEPGVLGFHILAKPIPFYTDKARQEDEKGTVALRIGFTENGGIDSIQIVSQLRYGLLQHAVSQAIRMKVLPRVKNGKPEPSTERIYYTFSIY